MKAITIEQQQESRRLRAEREFPRYRLRATHIAGHRAVYVIAPGGAIYTVNPRTGGCNCPDHLQRCAGTAMRCKHSIMVARFLHEEERRLAAERAELGRALIERARVEAQIDRDFPCDDDLEADYDGPAVPTGFREII